MYHIFTWIKQSKLLSYYIHKPIAMLEFITTLKQRYLSIQSGLNQHSSQWTSYQACIEQLTLIEAFLHKGSLIEQRQHPLHVAVIGPTQSGKSTITNLLLNQEAAGVSPLAGFTVHPQGFAVNLAVDALTGISEHFAGLQEVPQFALDHEEYDCYSVSSISNDSLPACMVWDTPDFDSIDAHSYKVGVLKTLALADVLLLVVSKEKYADQSVWDMMALLEPFQQPVLVVINKLVPDSERLITESFKERWQQVRTDTTPTILPILYSKIGDLADPQAELHELILASFKAVKRKKHQEVAYQYIKHYWKAWLLPATLEQEAYKQWQQMIDDAIADASKAYQRDYLDHPNHYDTFQNALAKLLTLLEIPGLAAVMAQSRKVLSWPLRKVFSLGRSAVKKQNPVSQETVVLQQISEHVLLQLGDKILDQLELSQENHKWWKAINSQLRQDKTTILQGFSQSTLAYHEDFQYEVDKTAQSLYIKLEEHPTILNGLRLTRVSADAAVLALAVQAGGIGLHDLILAPAMLSVTSYLAESAVGGYFTRAEQELKQQQLQVVTHLLFNQSLQQVLVNLPEKMAKNTHFNISTAQIAEAEAQLKVKPHGLRIF
jgi:GTPase Era involved in 16S rRNA processing